MNSSNDTYVVVYGIKVQLMICLDNMHNLDNIGNITWYVICI